MMKPMKRRPSGRLVATIACEGYEIERRRMRGGDRYYVLFTGAVYSAGKDLEGAYSTGSTLRRRRERDYQDNMESLRESRESFKEFGFAGK